MEAKITKVKGNNPVYSRPTSAARQCKRPATSLADGIAEVVRQKVAKRLRKFSLQQFDSSDQNEDTDMEEKQDNIVIKHKFLWPHEVVYNKDDSPSDFDTLSMPQFVRGFTILVHRAKPSIAKNMNLVLEEMMEDAKLYTWTSIGACHAILLQHIELGPPGHLRQSAKCYVAAHLVHGQCQGHHVQATFPTSQAARGKGGS